MALVDKIRPLAWEVRVRNQPLAETGERQVRDRQVIERQVRDRQVIERQVRDR